MRRGPFTLAAVLCAFTVVMAACGASPEVRTEVAERNRGGAQNAAAMGGDTSTGSMPAASDGEADAEGLEDASDTSGDLSVADGEGASSDSDRNSNESDAASTRSAGESGQTGQESSQSAQGEAEQDQSGPASSGATDTGVTADTVRVGGLFFNGSWLDQYSQVSEQASRAFFRFVNDQGGIHGREIEFITCDTGATVDGTQGCIRKLVEEDQVFVLGPTLDFNLDTVTDYVERHEIPWLGSPGLYDEEFASPMVFPTQLHGGDLGAIAITHVGRQMDADTLGVSWNTQPPGPACFDRLKRLAPSFDMQIIVDANNGQTESDLSSQVSRIRSADPDVVILCNDPVNIIKFVQAAARQNYKPPVGWIGVYTHAPDVPDALGEHGIGFLGLSMFDHYEADSQGVQEYRQILHHYYPRSFPHLYSQANFVGARAVVEVLQRIGPNVTRDRFLSELKSITDFDSRMGLRFNFNDREARKPTGIVFRVNAEYDWEQVTQRFEAATP